MQWTLQDVENWEELRPFVDTALLPLYFYREQLPLPQHVLRMTYLMNLATAIEQRLKGRIMLFPLAYQIAEDVAEFRVPSDFAFQFVLRFSGQEMQVKSTGQDDCVEYLTVGDEDLESKIRFEVTVEVLFQAILKKWQEGR